MEKVDPGRVEVTTPFTGLNGPSERRTKKCDPLNEIGVDFVSINLSIDTSPTTGEMVMVLISCLNKIEREKTVEKIKKSLEKKQEKGEPLGRPPYGLKYSEDKTTLGPADNFQKAITVIKMRNSGRSLSKIEEVTGVPTSTASRIVRRKKFYEDIQKNIQ